MNRLIFNRVTLISVLIVTLGWFAWTTTRERRSSGGLPTGQVTRSTLVQRVNVTGLITPYRTATLKAPYNGYVNKIFVKIGQKVKRGDPIVTVTQTPTDDGVSTFPLRAPFAGEIVQILKEEGSDVSTSDGSLVRIDDINRMFVESDAPEIDFPKLKLGQLAQLKASSLPQASYQGKIVSMYQAAKSQDRWDRSKVEFPIRVELLNPDSRLKPGMSVTMDIITEEAIDVLTLRHDFIGRRGNEYYVVLLNGTKQTVTVGMRSEEAFEITSGVTEGLQVQQIDFANDDGITITGRKPGRRR